MSYGFRMKFSQCKNFEDAFSKIQEFCKKVKCNLPSVFKDNDFAVERMIDNRTRNTDAETLFIYQFFNFNFVYWGEHNLLGISFGTSFECSAAENVFKADVFFQNSTDQDYDYTCWPDEIDLFKKIKEEVLSVPEGRLVDFVIASDKFYNESDREDLSKRHADYLRKTVLYTKIFTALH